jgi:hypothetical protein
VGLFQIGIKEADGPLAEHPVNVAAQRFVLTEVTIKSKVGKGRLRGRRKKKGQPDEEGEDDEDADDVIEDPGTIPPSVPAVANIFFPPWPSVPSARARVCARASARVCFGWGEVWGRKRTWFLRNYKHIYIPICMVYVWYFFFGQMK